MSDGVVAGTVVILFTLICAVAISHCNESNNRLMSECLKAGRSAAECRFMSAGQR
jgi:hypothetical protein